MREKLKDAMAYAMFGTLLLVLGAILGNCQVLTKGA